MFYGWITDTTNWHMESVIMFCVAFLRDLYQ